jgi:hypothetical protein
MRIPLISVALRSKAQICGRWIAVIAGSNPADGMEARPLCFYVLCR